MKKLKKKENHDSKIGMITSSDQASAGHSKYYFLKVNIKEYYHAKFQRAGTFMKYLMFRLSNLMNLAELVVNELTKSISKNIYQYSFFHPIYITYN